MEWNIVNQKLEKEFSCNDFSDAVTFVQKIAPIANEAEHHPDVLIHSYSKVRVMLTTHDQGQVTQKDYDLAKKIDQVS